MFAKHRQSHSLKNCIYELRGVIFCAVEKMFELARWAGSYSFYWHYRKILGRAAIALQAGNQRPQKYFVEAQLASG